MQSEAETNQAPKAVTFFVKVLDRFLPASMMTAGDEASRARVAVAISLLMVPVFLILAGAHVIAGRFREGLVNVGLATVTGVSPYLLRVTGRYLTIVNATIAMSTGALASIAFLDRGPGITAATLGLAEIPLFATLLMGIRVGAVWAVLSCLVSAAVGVFAPLAPERPARLERFNDHVVLVMVTATLFLVSVLYERGRTRSLAQIAELEAKRTRIELERMKAISDARVAQAERLASLGRVASAVGHEINNPLSYAVSNLEFVASQVGDSSIAEVRDAVDESLEGLRRIRATVAELFQFAAPGDDGGAGADVGASVDAALRMASTHLKAKATVVAEVGAVPRVRGDTGQLTQVLLNLLLNAAQAITEGRAVKNRIDVRAFEREGRVVIEIEDTGEGIPPDVVHSASDPSFSIKPTGEGLGLGLAVSHATLERMGGKLEFESRPGRTLARVSLAPVEAAPIEAAAPAPKPAADDGPGAILIVDDEPFILRALQRNLSAHRITTAPSGKEALRLLEGGASFDLILCDVMMPDVSGMDLYEAVRTSQPDVIDRFVFMTGGTFTSRAQSFRESVTNPFLEKPIDVKVVKALLEDLRAARRSRSV